MFVPSTLFREMGFHYTGPIDGHDLPALLGALEDVAYVEGSTVVACDHNQRKGYELAEETRLVTTPSPRLIRKRV